MFRWTHDSQNLLMFQSKNAIGSDHEGHLVKLEIATRKQTPLAEVMGRSSAVVDLSPDGDTLLFTAYVAAPPNGSVKPKAVAPFVHHLYELNIKEGSLRRISMSDRDVLNAAFSPSGNKILVAARSVYSYGRSYDNATLRVYDPTWGRPIILAVDASRRHSWGQDSVEIPGWVNDDFAHYHRRVETYQHQDSGSPNMMLARADGTSRRTLQPVRSGNFLGARGIRSGRSRTAPFVEPQPPPEVRVQTAGTALVGFVVVHRYPSG